jgi:hypothetical protein
MEIKPARLPRFGGVRLLRPVKLAPFCGVIIPGPACRLLEYRDDPMARHQDAMDD